MAGAVISVAPGARVPLSEANLRVWDVDTPTDEVWIEVRRLRRDADESDDSAGGGGVRVTDRRGITLKRFSLAQLLNGKVEKAHFNSLGKFLSFAESINR